MSGSSSLGPFALRTPQYDYVARQINGPGIVYISEATGMNEYDGMGWIIAAVKDREAMTAERGWSSPQGNHGPFPEKRDAVNYARAHVNDDFF